MYNISYINNTDLSSAIEESVNGNLFPLWNINFSKLDDYEQKKLISDIDFIINSLKIIPKEPKDELLKFFSFINYKHKYSDMIDLSTLKNKSFINKFWNNKFEKEIPKLFALIPYLSDEEIAIFFKSDDFDHLYDLSKSTDISCKQNINILTLKLFEIGFKKSLEAVSNSYYCYNHIDENLLLPFKNEQKKFSDICKEFILLNPELIPSYAKLFNESNEAINEQWFKYHLYKKNDKIIKHFIKNVFPKLSQQEKEELISISLENTSELIYFNLFLKYGFEINNVLDYKPKFTSIIPSLRMHKGEYLVKHLVKNNYFELMTFDEKEGLFPISQITQSSIDRTIKTFKLEEFLNVSDMTSTLINYQICGFNDNVYSGFQLACYDHQEFFSHYLNFNINEVQNVQSLFDEFPAIPYSQLNLKEKETLINHLLLTTWFSPTYSITRYDDHSETSLDLFVLSKYQMQESLYLIQEHLNLIKNHNIKNAFTQEYFNLIHGIFKNNLSPIRLTDTNNPFIIQLLDIKNIIEPNVSSENWKDLLTTITSISDKKIMNYSEYAKNFYRAMYNDCLNFTMIEKTNTTKKLKI